MKKPNFSLESVQYPKLYFFRILIHKFITYDTERAEWVGSSEMNPILLWISLWDINSMCNFLQASLTAVVVDILQACVWYAVDREMKSLRYNVLV